MTNADPGRPAFSVFLDANVLRGIDTTDLLLTAATTGAYSVHWSERVLEEAIRNRPPGVPLDKVLSRVRQMNSAFPEALVGGYEHLVHQMPADVKDQPILAAAKHSGAAAIVTENGRDFWPGADPSNEILCLKTSDVLRVALALRRDKTIRAVRGRVASMRRPPATMSQYLDRIVDQYELAPFARAINGKLPPAERGSDPRLDSRLPKLDPAARALAGQGSMVEALRHERERSNRSPRAREWAARRRGGPGCGGVER